MPVPHAYAVEYRVADACFPPRCTVDGRRVYGRADTDPPGGYVVVGTDKDELFAKRGSSIAPSKELSFTLPSVEAGTVLEASLAAVGPAGGVFRVVLEVRAGGRLLATRDWQGTTQPFERHNEPNELGREERYFRHVRELLPVSAAEVVVTLRNEGAVRVGLGAANVLRRIEGRPARQAVLVFFDAVPHPVFAELYGGTSAASAWIAGWTKRGTLFPEAVSPGQLTGSFVRRFFRADYYRLEGEPSLAGQGFDDAAPARAPGPVARLVEQGFVTEAIASNLYLSPVLSRVGFDSDYNIESTLDLQIHPPVLAARFAKELEIHAEDDALFVVWFANTHAPWGEGRANAPPLHVPGGSRDDFDFGVLDPIWRNMLDSVDALRTMVESADRGDSAERTWVLAADHGHTFTALSRARPWRLTREAVEDGHMHCCLATAQEARTFVAVVPDRGPGQTRRTVSEPVSTMSVWSEIERRLNANLELPRTSAFGLPGGAGGAGGAGDAGRFDDGILVSVGNSGALFGRSGDWSYHAYNPAPELGPAWELGPKMSRLLFGSSMPAGGVPSEELYDVSQDRFEKENLADERFPELLDMRRRMTDWLAEYVDDPEHERYQYRLDFGRQVTLDVHAPRAFSIAIDAEPAHPADPVVELSGTSFRFRDGERPLGVVDLAGPSTSPSLLVRCRWSGLPLATLDDKHARLNLALARTNCPTAHAVEMQIGQGEAFFDAELVDRKRRDPNERSAGSAPELKSALERWGYVRDKP